MHTTWPQPRPIDAIDRAAKAAAHASSGQQTDAGDRDASESDVASDRPAPPLPAHDWALFLDVDGSLLDFAAQPDAVEVPAGMQEHLAALAARLDGALALVSGRALATLDVLFEQLQHLPAAGLHGLEWRSAHGGLHPAPDAPESLDSIEAEAQRIAAAYPGAAIERKGPSLAFHWRAAPQAQDPFRAFAAAALRVLPDYRPQFGDRVLELRPEGMDKGAAVRAFLAQAPFAGRVPVFVGDDLTDEHGFAVVNTLGGLSVLVGDRAYSEARYRLPGPAAVRDWVREAVEAPPSPRTHAS
jgi:trehalose 6-phosphate phosphatase